MFDKFTNRAKQVIKLAKKEAQRLNHNYLGTEHVLLGLFKLGQGVAVNVLRNLISILKLFAMKWKNSSALVLKFKSMEILLSPEK